MTARAIVEAMYDAYGKGDLEGTFVHFAKDVNHTANACHNGGRFCGAYDGLDALRERVTEILTHWAFDSYVPQSLTVEGEKVAALVRITGHQRHTGARLETIVAHFMTVKDGKITALTEVFDGAPLEAAMAHAA